jgi:hypothetical protein
VQQPQLKAFEMCAVCKLYCLLLLLLLLLLP